MDYIFSAENTGKVPNLLSFSASGPTASVRLLSESHGQRMCPGLKAEVATAVHGIVDVVHGVVARVIQMVQSCVMVLCDVTGATVCLHLSLHLVTLTSDCRARVCAATTALVVTHLHKHAQHSTLSFCQHLL